MPIKRILAILLIVGLVFSVSVSAEAKDKYDPKPTKHILGDADLDGEVTVLDATAIQLTIAEICPYEIGKHQSDTDGDGVLTILDATYIQVFLAEIANPYNIGEALPTHSLFLVRDHYVTYVGGSTGIRPVMTPADYDSLIYTSSNPRVARVYDDGRVIGVRQGEADITISTTDPADLSVTAHVKVLYSESSASRLDDFYSSMTSEAESAARIYINSDSELREIFAYNNNWLGYDTFSTLYADSMRYDEAVWDYIIDGLSKYRYPFEDNTPEDAVAAMYSTTDMNYSDQSRNSAAAETYVREWFSKIDSVKTTDDLLRLCAEIQLDGGESFLDVSVDDQYDPSMGMVYVKTLFDADTILSDFDDSTVNRLADNYIRSLFEQAGMKSSTAKSESAALLALAKKITDETYDRSMEIADRAERADEETADQILEEVDGKFYDVSDLDRLLTNINLQKYLSYLGLSADGRIYAEIPVQMKVIDHFFTASNLSSFKAFLKYTTAFSALQYTHAGNKAYNTLYKAIYGEIVDFDDYLLYSIEEELCWELVKIRTDMFGFDNQKAAITEMCGDIVDAYRTEIQTTSWLSPDSKQALIDKLNNLRLNVLYPDDFASYLLPFDLDTKSEEATFFDNIIQIRRYRKTQYNAEDGHSASSDSWKYVDTSEVNSSYFPWRNSLYIYEGIINPLTFDETKPDAYNLSRLGSVIAHEIGHAFDPDGVEYNLNGAEQTILTDEDMEKYRRKQNDLIRVFDTFYIGLNGTNACYEDGVVSLDENIADLSSLETILSMVQPSGYRTIFEGLTTLWIEKEDFDYENHIDDVHATNKGRINAIIPMTDAFYEAYSIMPGNAMYVAPKYRVHLWD